MMDGSGETFFYKSIKTRLEQAVEVAVFLFLIVPSMALSFFSIREGTLGFVVTGFSVIFRDLALMLLVLFFLWRNGERLSSVGWVRRGFFREFLLGILLYVPFFYIVSYMELVLRVLGLKAPLTPLPALRIGGGFLEVLLAVALVVVVAVTEETIFRGYLIKRFEKISGSAGAAVVFSTAVFTLGHGYEGTLGLGTVAVMGFLLAMVYRWRGSLVAPMVIHFIQDFLGIVVVPLLLRK